jgi:hypothetical protein
MAHPTKPVTCAADAFEIIELLSDDLNVLTRAFEVINAVCREEDSDRAIRPVGIPEEFLQ